MAKIEWLERYVSGIGNCEDVEYSVDAIKKNFETVDLPLDAVLVLKWSHPKDKFWLDFAVLEFEHSDIDDTNVHAISLFYGNGPSDSLRELRHTYFGKEGYLFYVKPIILVAAFKELSKYFDDLELE